MSRRSSRTVNDLLVQLAGLLGQDVRLLHAHEREWASITFAGARHRFVWEVPEQAWADAGFQQALASLPEHEFTLRGDIAADCTATLGAPIADSGDGEVRLLIVEVLTVNAD